MFHEKGANGNKCEYPFTRNTIIGLKDSRLVNPKVGRDHGYKIPDFFDKEKSLDEVLDVRSKVRREVFPADFMSRHYPFKKEFGNYSFPDEVFSINKLYEKMPIGLANVVHMDSPSDMPKMLLKWLTHPYYDQGANVKSWNKDYINFLETIPDCEESIASKVKKGLDKGFEMKYFFGLERPEICYHRRTGKDGKSITAYAEGCPNHPSFPAGHACAAAAGVTALIKEIDLSPYQLTICLDVAYSWAMFRTFAGVHYAEDNIMGLIVGGLGKYMKKEILDQYKK